MGLASESNLVCSLDSYANCSIWPATCDGFEDNARSQRTRGGVDLGLWEIKRVLALEVATAHIVAGCPANDLKFRVDDQCEIGLRHRPAGIPTNPDMGVRPNYLRAVCLEEQLTTFALKSSPTPSRVPTR